MNLPRLVLYTTPESRAANQISLLATTEAVIAAALFWWLAEYLGNHLHLWLAVIAAPCLLLRSAQSIRAGAAGFMRYWQPEVNSPLRLPLAVVAAGGGIGTGLIIWWVAGNWLTGYSGLAAFWAALGLGVVATNIGMAVAVAAWGFWAFEAGKIFAVTVAGASTLAAVTAIAWVNHGTGALSGAGALAVMALAALAIAGLSVEKALVGRTLRGIGIGAILLTFGFSIYGQTVGGDGTVTVLGVLWLSIWAIGLMAAVAGLVGTRGLAFVAIGAGVGIFVTACAIRFQSTMKNLAAGVHAFPENWLSLIFHADILQRPEVVPGLPAGHVLRAENRYTFWDQVSHLEDWKNRMMVVLLLDFPYAIYRICLKSTVWFYLPIFLFIILVTRRED